MTTTTRKLIGPAGRLADVLLESETETLKLLLCGAPGIGKTELANQLATRLCGGTWGVVSENGRNVTIHVVREWMRDCASSSLFGTGWKVWVVNEVDTMPSDAQDALLTFLDEMGPERAFIATSNLDLDKLTKRFATRLLRREVEAPSVEEIAAMLCADGIPAMLAQQFAFLCDGCVRAALQDAAAWQNETKLKQKRAPKPQQAGLMLA